jgi:hypothetical protein
LGFLLELISLALRGMPSLGIAIRAAAQPVVKYFRALLPVAPAAAIGSIDQEMFDVRLLMFDVSMNLPANSK